MPIFFQRISIALSLLFLLGSAYGYDERRVTTPKIPEVCQVLFAQVEESTAQIQNALNHCHTGQAVHLLEKNDQTVFLTGPLRIPTGVSLWIDVGVTLKAFNRAAIFDDGSGQCGRLGGDGKACKALITFDRTSGGGIYGQGSIDGQGGEKPFDRDLSWWDLARQAQLLNVKYNSPRLIQMNHSQNMTLNEIHLKNSAHFTVVFAQGDGLTVWGIDINNPSDARNTDGIDLNSSKNITIAHSHISTGDDHIAIKANIHTGSTENISLFDNQFEAGHGLSIGSETQAGVYNIDVDSLLINHAKNGLRIKSDRSAAGEVHDVRYKNIRLFNVDHAIVQDTFYENKAGKTEANWHDINYQNIDIKGKSELIFNGVNAIQPLFVDLTQVQGLVGVSWKVEHAMIKKP